MKLSAHAFTRFWDVHAWVGVTAGLVLHVMFFAGGVSLFYDELSLWQERGAAAPDVNAPLAPLVQTALAGADPRELDLSLPSSRQGFLELGWPGANGAREERRLHPATGAAAVETSHLARILFWLHFLYHPSVSWGMQVAGIFGVAYLLAVVTGVLIHLKDIVRQFHQFRPRRTAKLLWSDLHKVLGVMGLPFQVTYAFTGAVIALGAWLLAAFTGPVFRGDADAAQQALWGRPPAAVASGRRAPTLDVDQLRARAAASVPGFVSEYIHVAHRGDEAATAHLWGQVPGRFFGHGEVLLRGRDGALVFENITHTPTAAAAINRWIYGLHYVWFGGLATKVMFTLLAIASCLTILSGNWIWLSRRDDSFGNRVLARLTIGVGGGVVLAAALLFWANRLAPAGARMTAESWAFFGSWGLLTIAFLARAESRAGWVGLLRVAGVAYALVPAGSVIAGASVDAVDAGVALFGASLLVLAALVARFRTGRRNGVEAAA